MSSVPSIIYNYLDSFPEDAEISFARHTAPNERLSDGLQEQRTLHPQLQQI